MKAVELRELKDEELVQKLEDCEEELFNLRFKTAISPPENPKRAGIVKKTIARIKTILHERKLQDKGK